MNSGDKIKVSEKTYEFELSTCIRKQKILRYIYIWRRVNSKHFGIHLKKSL